MDIALPLVCFAAWYAAAFTAITVHSLVESLFCPADQMVSGMCGALWFKTFDAWLVRFFCAFAAALIIVCGYLVAPVAARPRVVWFIFAVGAASALWMASFDSAWYEFTAAGIGGLVTVWLLVGKQTISRRIDGVATQNT